MILLFLVSEVYVKRIKPQFEKNLKKSQSFSYTSMNVHSTWVFLFAWSVGKRDLHKDFLLSLVAKTKGKLRTMQLRHIPWYLKIEDCSSSANLPCVRCSMLFCTPMQFPLYQQDSWNFPQQKTCEKILHFPTSPNNVAPRKKFRSREKFRFNGDPRRKSPFGRDFSRVPASPATEICESEKVARFAICDLR